MLLSKSPERNTFQRDCYIREQEKKGKIDDPETQKMLEYYNSRNARKHEKENDPSWQENNLEYDLRSTNWILKKVRDSESYAQDLYAAMCNNEFLKKEVIPILREEKWGCSWRYAGGIIADMREKGDYVDWYCSGNEGQVTDEVQNDLLKLGWIVITHDD